MSWYGDAWDSTTDFLFGDSGDQIEENIKNGKQYAYMGKNPYQSGWNSLINQLSQRAQGKNSLAEKQVKDVHAAGMNRSAAMGAGRSAGAARSGALAMGKMSQGLAGQAGQARLAESMAAQQALQAAYTNAGNADYQRAAANQAFYGNQLGISASTPSDAQKAAGIAAQVGGAVAGTGGGQSAGAARQAPSMNAPNAAAVSEVGLAYQSGPAQGPGGAFPGDPYRTAPADPYFPGQSNPYGSRY